MQVAQTYPLLHPVLRQLAADPQLAVAPNLAHPPMDYPVVAHHATVAAAPVADVAQTHGVASATAIPNVDLADKPVDPTAVVAWLGHPGFVLIVASPVVPDAVVHMPGVVVPPIAGVTSADRSDNPADPTAVASWPGHPGFVVLVVLPVVPEAVVHMPGVVVPPIAGVTSADRSDIREARSVVIDYHAASSVVPDAVVHMLGVVVPPIVGVTNADRSDNPVAPTAVASSLGHPGIVDVVTSLAGPGAVVHHRPCVRPPTVAVVTIADLVPVGTQPVPAVPAIVVALASLVANRIVAALPDSMARNDRGLTAVVHRCQRPVRTGNRLATPISPTFLSLCPLAVVCLFA
jgi:hypothetical protein